MSVRKSIVLLLTGLLLCTLVHAESDIVSYSSDIVFTIDGRNLSMGEMLNLLLKNNYDLRSQRHDYRMADSDSRKYEQKFAPYVTGEVGAGSTTYPDDLHTSTGEQKDTWDVTTSIRKAFKTGTTVSGGVGTEYSKTTDMPLGVSPQFDETGNITGMEPVARDMEGYQPSVYLMVEQQLLKNGFGVNDRKMTELLENSADINRESVKAQMSGAAASLIISFWELALARESRTNAQIKLSETIKVRNIVSENVKLGLAENFDLNYYNALVAGARISREQAQQQLEDKRRNIRTMLALDPTVEIGETVELHTKLPELDRDQILHLAMTRRSDYRIAQLSLKSARQQIAINENEDLPELKGSASVNTFGYHEEFTDSMAFGGSGYEIRMTMTHPLSNPEQDTNLRDARLSLEKAKLSLEKTEREIRDDIESRIQNVNTTFEVYRQARAARIQSRVYYQKMQANLRRGRFTAATVKNGLDAYIDSKQNELQALVGYNIALVQLDIATNMIFEKFGIDVTSYMQRGIE
ncbi:MAG: TolC family protein [Spirochaetota bacterium]